VRGFDTARGEGRRTRERITGRGHTRVRWHAVPVGQELEALEARENAREILNALLPGLWEDTLALLEDTCTSPLEW
jgi:hypothetical protein